ncbi:MAG: hydroxymethylglutaryl-CoA reductase [Chitinophagales bacterium]
MDSKTKAQQFVEGFSKLSKTEKINWIVKQYFDGDQQVFKEFENYWHKDPSQQKLYDEFSENTLTNYYMPFGVAPNFLINNEVYTLPMVIEESSVVAAASKSAKFWRDKGGFHAEVLDIQKIGQVHFMYSGDKAILQEFFKMLKPKLIRDTHSITRNMKKRGGGILDIELIDKTNDLENYYQLRASFNTCDSMGANFINSCLEKFAEVMRAEAGEFAPFDIYKEPVVDVVMSILSNYTPDCIVRVSASCTLEELVDAVPGMGGREFADRVVRAVKIAEVDPYRATTHNKGIFNGIDSVILATGNDFRAVEACGHTYAARNGRYSSLSHADINGNIFTYSLEVPLSVGTVGGLTNLHPLVKRAMNMLGNPNAEKLMMIAATAGLANNFSAIKSLVTDGIQKGHMKMHLLNILKTMDASFEEVEAAKKYFTDNVVSYPAVRNFLISVRSNS